MTPLPDFLDTVRRYGGLGWLFECQRIDEAARAEARDDAGQEGGEGSGVVVHTENLSLA